MNHSCKYSKYLVSVITNMGTNISGWYIVFYEGVKQKDLGKIAHILKYLHGRIFMSPFEICFHEGSLWRGHGLVISFIISKQFLSVSLVIDFF